MRLGCVRAFPHCWVTLKGCSSHRLLHGDRPPTALVAGLVTAQSLRSISLRRGGQTAGARVKVSRAPGGAAGFPGRLCCCSLAWEPLPQGGVDT